MSPGVFGLIVVSVTLSAFAQISMKFGMSSPAVQQAIATSGAGAWMAILSSLGVLIGLSLYGLGAGVWLLVLAKTDVTLAYPFVGLSFFLTLAFGYFFLGEPVSLMRVAGVVLIAAGIGLIARS